jgi:hypothetical protein
LVTSRLDNDDGLHRDYVKLLQDQVRVGTEEVLDFPWGIVYCNGVPYLSHQKSNAFIALSEPLQGVRTVTAGRHNEMSRRYRVRSIGSGPAWLQVVHGSNVSNKIRGWRISRDWLPEGFEFGGAVAPEDKSRFGILLENASLGIARHARDMAADSWNLRLAGQTKFIRQFLQR